MLFLALYYCPLGSWVQLPRMMVLYIAPDSSSYPFVASFISSRLLVLFFVVISVACGLETSYPTVATNLLQGAVNSILHPLPWVLIKG